MRRRVLESGGTVPVAPLHIIKEEDPVTATAATTETANDEKWVFIDEAIRVAKRSASFVMLQATKGKIKRKKIERKSSGPGPGSQWAYPVSELRKLQPLDGQGKARKYHSAVEPKPARKPRAPKPDSIAPVAQAQPLGPLPLIREGRIDLPAVFGELIRLIRNSDPRATVARVDLVNGVVDIDTVTTNRFSVAQ